MNGNNNEIIKNEPTSFIQGFISWKDKLPKQLRGGKIMYDVPKHYKWLNEDELFFYYTRIKITYV